jgi:MraZ protein
LRANTAVGHVTDCKIAEYFFRRSFLYTFIVGKSGEKWDNMPGFIGKERHSIDEKGRLLIPARFRRRLLLQAGEMDDASGREESVLYVMKAEDGSLELYEPGIWNEKEKQLLKLSDFNPDERLLTTLIYERLDHTELDRSGRIALSKDSLAHAGITKDVVIIGANIKMIIWEPERLSRLIEENSGRFALLAGRYV